MTAGTSTPPGNHAAAAPRFGLLWAVKRALLGIAILVVMFGGGAWLMYETIEPDRADAREAGSPAAIVSRQ